MAIQQITKKRIIKHDTSNPNYKAEPLQEKPKPNINGNNIDNIKVKNGNLNVYDESVQVDVKRNVFLAKPDEASVKIDKVKKGKVNNKVNKLRALRKRNGN